jgi:hypothetical protein
LNKTHNLIRIKIHGKGYRTTAAFATLKTGRDLDAAFRFTPLIKSEVNSQHLIFLVIIVLCPEFFDKNTKLLAYFLKKESILLQTKAGPGGSPGLAPGFGRGDGWHGIWLVCGLFEG